MLLALQNESVSQSLIYEKTKNLVRNMMMVMMLTKERIRVSKNNSMDG